MDNGTPNSQEAPEEKNSGGNTSQPEQGVDSSGRNKPRLRRILTTAGMVAGVAFVGIQFIPVDGLDNPEARSDMAQESPHVVAFLRRSCFDCHSNETEYPWYSHVAPVSWLLARDVREGRAALNFSEWDEMDDFDRQFARESAKDMVVDGDMPPWFYLPLHPDAAVSEDERKLMQTWANQHAAGARSAGL